MNFILKSGDLWNIRGYSLVKYGAVASFLHIGKRWSSAMCLPDKILERRSRIQTFNRIGSMEQGYSCLNTSDFWPMSHTRR